MANRIYGADWVVPVASPPLRDAVVVIEGSRIAWIGHEALLPAQYRATEIDWTAGVITPGLVNAHTHLQYSGFDSLGRGQYRGFEDWSVAFETLYHTDREPCEWGRAAAQGVKLGLASGTTVFSEIITSDEARGAIGQAQASGIEYLEVIAETTRSWSNGGREELIKWLGDKASIETGISPHAPYNLDPSVVTDLVEIAKARGMRLHSHLGESALEEAFYLTGDPAVLFIYGDLRDEYHLVQQKGAGLKTAAYADSVGLLGECTHIAHGVYFDKCQRDLLRQRGTRVALCPRSNAVIGLAEAPVAAYLAEGHDIAVGTDSLASAPSLDLMADVKALARIAHDQGYGEGDLWRRVVQAATLGGARALGMAKRGYGALIAGGPADLALFAIDVAGDEVERALVEQGEGRCVLTVAQGRVAHDSRTNASGIERHVRSQDQQAS